MRTSNIGAVSGYNCFFLFDEYLFASPIDVRRRIIAEWILRRRLNSIVNAAKKKKSSRDQTAVRLARSTQLYVFLLLIPFAYTCVPSPATTRRCSVARQIAAARTCPFAPSTQTSSFEVLRPPSPHPHCDFAEWARLPWRASLTPQPTTESADTVATPAPCLTRRLRWWIARLRTHANSNAAGRIGRYAISHAYQGLLVDVETLRRIAR